MDKKSHPFSDLTERDLDAIISRAQRERAEAIATAYIWLGRRLHRLLVTPLARLWSLARPSGPAHKAP